MDWTGNLKPKLQIMVFRPTMKEFSNFSKYIEHMEQQGAHKIGLAKVIPPTEWVARVSGYDNIDIIIPAPIKQEVCYEYGAKGAYKVINIARKAMTVREYEQLANSSKFKTPKNRGYEDLERKFWNSLTMPAPIYGADISGTVTDASQCTWNIAKLNTVLNSACATRIDGVNTPYLYFGMWKAMFAWHTEDMDLYSINYLHYGAAKAWYAIPPEHGRRFERLANGLFANDAKQCPAFLRHKMYLITPRTLHDNSIPYCKTWQEPGEFMITFPYSYHAGYNLGYNCAESTNFASERWIDYGKSCSYCRCQDDMVSIDMEPFVRIFQPDEYEMWKTGLKQRHPEDKSQKPYARQLSDAVSESSSRSEMSKNKPQISRRIPVAACSPKAKIAVAQNDDDDARQCDTDAIKFNDDETKRTLTGGCRTHRPSSLQMSSKKRKRDDDDDAHELVNSSTRRRNWTPDVLPHGNAAAAAAAASGKNILSRSSSSSVEKSRLLNSDDHLTYCLLSPVGECSQVGFGLSAVRDRLFNDGLDSSDAPRSVRRNERSMPTVPCDDFNQNGSSNMVHQPVSATLALPTAAGSSRLARGSSCTVSGVPNILKRSVAFSGVKTSVEVSSTYTCGSALSKRPSNDVAGSSSALGVVSRNVSIRPVGTIKTERHSAESATIDDSSIHRPTYEKWRRTDDKEVIVTSSVDTSHPSFCKLLKGLSAVFKEEVDFNTEQSVLPPYCAVCALFVSRHKDSRLLAGGGDASTVTSSMPCVPELLFLGHDDDVGLLEMAAHKRLSTETSCLITCKICGVRVHASCYGVELSAGQLEHPWTCDRCCIGREQDSCCLCELRGGALKRTNCGQWAHIVCVLGANSGQSGALFDNVTTRSVEVDRSRLHNYKKCIYCRRTSNTGILVTCSFCGDSFHVTCGFIADATFTVSSTSSSVSMLVYCTKHSKRQHQRNSHHLSHLSSLAPVAVGDRVIAKHKNHRYYQGIVVSQLNTVYCHVAYTDGSFSDDMLQEDIVVPHGKPLTMPTVGSFVKVWYRKKLYEALFRGMEVRAEIEVRFDDGYVLKTERSKIWRDSDKLPSKVASKYSVATSTMYNLFAPVSHDILQSRTRTQALRTKVASAKRNDVRKTDDRL